MQEKLKEILNYYGEKAQANQLVQELAELMVGITKNDIENIKEEIADVEVMIEQFKMFKFIDLNKYERLKRIYMKDEIGELIEEKLKLEIVELQRYVIERDRINSILSIAKFENLIDKYMKMKEIDRKQINEIIDYKIDRQLKRINAVG